MAILSGHLTFAGPPLSLCWKHLTSNSNHKLEAVMLCKVLYHTILFRLPVHFLNIRLSDWPIRERNYCSIAPRSHDNVGCDVTLLYAHWSILKLECWGRGQATWKARYTIDMHQLALLFFTDHMIVQWIFKYIALTNEAREHLITGGGRWGGRYEGRNPHHAGTCII